MRSRLGTVAQNALTSNALPQASRRFTARTKWGRAFFNAQREGCALFSLRSCRRTSRSFTPGVALSEPLLGVLSKHESGGVSLPRFLLQSKGEGRALRPCCEKSGGLFFKSPRLSCETRGLLRKTPPFFGACPQRMDERSLPAFHTLRRWKSPWVGCLVFPRPRNLQRP